MAKSAPVAIGIGMVCTAFVAGNTPWLVYVTYGGGLCNLNHTGVADGQSGQFKK